MTDAIDTTEKPLSNRLKRWFLIRLCMCVFIGLMHTIRYRFENLEYREQIKKHHPNGAHIFALWHENIFAAVSAHRGQGILPMISLSNDGEMITRICTRLGYQPPVRGSSSRGGHDAMNTMVNAIKDGAVGAMTVDGPRGPRREVKLGIIRIASKTGVPIVPCSAKTSRMWIFRSWDRFRLAKPFAKITIIYGKTVFVPPMIAKSEMKKYADELAHNLNALEATP